MSGMTIYRTGPLWVRLRVIGFQVRVRGLWVRVRLKVTVTEG